MMVFSHGLFSNSEEITATKLSAFSSEKVCTDSWHRWNNPPATVKIIFHGANTVWCLWKDIISIFYLQYAKYLLYKLILTCQMTGEMLLLTRQKENEMKTVEDSKTYPLWHDPVVYNSTFQNLSLNILSSYHVGFSSSRSWRISY